MNMKKKQPLLLSRTVKQAFEIKKVALPWTRAVSAGLCIGLPSLIGFLLGHFQYGLLAGTGGFTYLYVANEPYALRAKKIFFVLLGITFSVVSGTLLAPIPVLAAFILGIIGALANFLFGALKFKGPGALFFVLSFALATGMPVDPSQALTRGFLVFLGGLLAWFIAMGGWLFKPHGPEISAVRQLYKDLAGLLESVGTSDYNRVRHRTLMSMYDAEAAFAAGRGLWRNSDTLQRLFRLYTHAQELFPLVDKISLKEGEKLPPELGNSVRRVAMACGEKGYQMDIEMPEVELSDPDIQELIAQMMRLPAILNEPNSTTADDRRMTTTPARSIILSAFDKNSVVFLLSVRFGIILTIAAATAHAFNLNRSYWVPLSCASVMLGATVVATFHRAIQRSLGTMIGILIASAILWAQPEGFVVSIAIMLFTFFAELLIVRNYAFAMLFVTPNAMLMAETNTHIHKLTYFAGARLTDVIVGSVIGLIGVLLIGRRSASSRIPYLMGKTIRSQSQLLALLFSRQPVDYTPEGSLEQRSMMTHLSNLTTVYLTAFGEIPRNEEELGKLLPAIWSMDQFGYLLNGYARDGTRPVLPDSELADLLLYFEKMAQAAQQRRPISGGVVPDTPYLPKIKEELTSLGHALANSLK